MESPSAILENFDSVARFIPLPRRGPQAFREGKTFKSFWTLSSTLGSFASDLCGVD